MTSPSSSSAIHFELGEHKIWRFFLQICLALEAVHEKGIVHADLKPSNLLMAGRDYDLKLTDFGISQKLKICSKFPILAHSGVQLFAQIY